MIKVKVSTREALTILEAAGLIIYSNSTRNSMPDFIELEAEPIEEPKQITPDLPCGHYRESCYCRFMISDRPKQIELTTCRRNDGQACLSCIVYRL